MATTKTRGYSASREELLTRLAKIEGQVRGVARMVQSDRYCIDVVTQINATRAALDKVALGLLLRSHRRDPERHLSAARVPPPKTREQR
jgi:DNA-binding FrmR family transcriptional regulator